ncbi:MAG: ABC transporter permease [Gammaproteobacteria bacterium]|nr:ABC transporter permease [Gammaproteobacteria bacterium]
MNMLLKKAISDIRYEPGRFALVVFALVIGIWGVGAILVSYTVLSQDMPKNFLETAPPHVVLVSDDFVAGDASWVNALSYVDAAEFREYSVHRIEIQPDLWVPLRLYGLYDFSHTALAHVYHQEGEQIPAAGSMLIERNGRLISNIKVGSAPRVRMNNSTHEIAVSGIAFDPAQPPATQDHFIFGYMHSDTYRQFTGESPYQRMIVRFRNVGSKDDVAVAVTQLREAMARQGKKLRIVSTPNFNAHPHQWQLDSLLLLQGSIGFLAFVMAAVLVSQLMASLLSKQLRQIAVLKAIGGRRSQVFVIYLLMVVSLGVLSGAIGIPLAIASGYGLAYGTALQLNFEILTTQLPFEVYLVLIAAALLLPLLFSLSTIIRGTAMSVKQGIGEYGLDASMQKIRSASSITSYLPGSIVFAVRNSMRRKSRLIVTLVSMAFGVAMFDAGFNVRHSLFEMLQQTSDSMRYDVKLVLKAPVSREKLLPLFEDVEGVKRIEAWSGGKGVLQSEIFTAGNGIGITALPFDTQLRRPDMLQGRWLSGAAQELVMNTQAWKDYGFPDMDTQLSLGIGGKTISLTLVGLVEEFDTTKFYIDQQQYDAMFNPEHLVNSLMFAAQDRRYASVIQLKTAIEKIVADSALPVLDVESQQQRVKILYDHLNIILMSFVVFALMVLSVSALGMASVMGINVLERTREIGVLRAIGATPGHIYRLFVSEGMLLGMIGVALGLILSWPLSQLGARFWGDLIMGGADLPLSISPAGVAITVVTTVFFCWFASHLPSRNAIRISTREALAYE